MPRRRKGKPADEAEAWQAESFGRISARAQEREAIATAPSQWGFEKLATQPMEKLAMGEASEAGERQAQRSAEQTAQYAFRTSKESQMAAGFDPHRHTVFVCGRPVQVMRREIIHTRFPSAGLG